MDIIKEIIQRAQQQRQRIVLPEGTEPRTIQAADRAIENGTADVILLGKREEIL
ncbi:MAG: phosphate acyltransferase, partial [Bacteroidaceae bacterium]